jgi:hypothetical protein
VEKIRIVFLMIFSMLNASGWAANTNELFLIERDIMTYCQRNHCRNANSIVLDQAKDRLNNGESVCIIHLPGNNYIPFQLRKYISGNSISIVYFGKDRSLAKSISNKYRTAGASEINFIGHKTDYQALISPYTNTCNKQALFELRNSGIHRSLIAPPSSQSGQRTLASNTIISIIR